MHKQTVKYHQLSAGTLFRLSGENDGRTYRKIADHGAVDIESGRDCIPRRSDACVIVRRASLYQHGRSH